MISAFGSNVERIQMNQTDPDPALGDDALDEGAPAPVPDRRRTWCRALSLAIDREILVETGYGAAGQVTCNLVPAPEINASTEQRLVQASRTSTRRTSCSTRPAGRRARDGVRAKDGKRL